MSTHSEEWVSLLELPVDASLAEIDGKSAFGCSAFLSSADRKWIRVGGTIFAILFAVSFVKTIITTLSSTSV